MEIAQFFFSYSGLGMAIVEYEIRYFLINGDYIENPPEDYVAPAPRGISDINSKRL
jgi:hypothetical protein